MRQNCNKFVVEKKNGRSSISGRFAIIRKLLLPIIIIIKTFINVIIVIIIIKQLTYVPNVSRITMSKVSVSISIDSKVIYQMEQLAEKEGKTRTEKIVEILNDWIEKKKGAR